MKSLIKAYGQGLFEVALEQNQVSRFLEETNLVEASIQNEDLMFFKSYSILKETKKEVVVAAFEKQLNPMIMHFLCILIDKNLMGYIKEILIEFRSICNQELGIEEGIVYSNIELDFNTIQNIEQALSTKMNKTIHLINKKDSQLIGGIKVVINDQVFDDSIHNRLESLRASLLKG